MTSRAGAERDALDLRRVRQLSLVFLLCAIVFFPMILNPVIFGFFDAKSDAERLDHVQGHLGSLRLLFTGIGVSELALGFALWTWGRYVRRRTPGWPGTLAYVFAGIALVAGFAAIVSRASIWFQDAEQFATDTPVVTMASFGVAAVGFSLTFIVYGVLMVRGAMPTWLGVVWVFCGVIFWLGILPLWFFVGGLTFGVWGLVALRSGHGSADRIFGVRVPKGDSS